MALHHEMGEMKKEVEHIAQYILRDLVDDTLKLLSLFDNVTFL